MTENKGNFKIGDKVKVKISDELVCTGELLGLNKDTPHVDFWIVLIKDRFSEHMKNQPEKAFVISHTYLEKIENSDI